MIRSRHQQGYPRPFLAIPLYCPSLPASLQGYILYRHRASRPAFACPFEGVHKSMSLMSSSLLLPQCPARLVRLTWIIVVIVGTWPYSSCFFVGCRLQDLFNIAQSILMYLPSNLFSTHFVSVQIGHPYSSTVTAAAWKKLRFILSVRSDFHMTDSLSIAVYAFASREWMSLSVDETLLPRWVNLPTSFSELPFSVEMSPLWLKPIYSVLGALAWRPMPTAVCSRLCSRVSAWVGAFARSAVIDVVDVRNCLCRVPSASILL